MKNVTIRLFGADGRLKMSQPWAALSPPEIQAQGEYLLKEAGMKGHVTYDYGDSTPNHPKSNQHPGEGSGSVLPPLPNADGKTGEPAPKAG